MFTLKIKSIQLRKDWRVRTFFDLGLTAFPKIIILI